MSNAKHTPGPWNRNIKPARKYITIFAGKNTHVAKLVTGSFSDEELEAHADLITARADLLDALVAIVTTWETGLDFSNEIGEARAAIAKATGA